VENGSTVINLGTGAGTTVRELVAAFEKAVGRSVDYTETGPRLGDIAGAYTFVDRAQALLYWKARYSLDEGIRHSLEWTSHRDEMLSSR
jgi:UDP-glucose 4-epimerase